MRLTSTPIVWNTGAPYTARGQRIAAARIDGVPYFADIDRGLAYSFTCHGEITKDYVMHVYHKNLGADASWQIRDLLLPFVEDVTPCTWEFYELARKIRQGASLTEAEKHQLPQQRGLWADKFLDAWEKHKQEKPCYKVECRFSYGWDDAGWAQDDKPMRFASIAEANAEIDEFIADAKHLGGYEAEDYRVVPAGPAPSP